MFVALATIVLMLSLDLGAAQRRRREVSRPRTIRREASRPRIIGGIETRNRDSTPYVVKLVVPGGGSCSGTIIDAFHVLSAAHCFADRFSYGRQTKFSVDVVIAHNVDTDQPIYAARGSVVAHPGFAEFGGTTAEQDFAVITLTSPIPIGVRGVRALPLATSTPPEGSLTIATGYGLRTYALDELSPIARSITSPITRCPPGVTRNTICTRGIDENGQRGSPCMGDSGGPLVFEGRLIGVLSRGARDCGRSGVENTILWGEVSRNMDWLRDNLGLGQGQQGQEQPPARPPVSPPQRPDRPSSSQPLIQHVVRFGDSLQGIADLYGVTMREVEDLNRGKRFVEGTVLDIPDRRRGPVPPPSSSIVPGSVIGGGPPQTNVVVPPQDVSVGQRPTQRTHVVRRGDTYFSLARLYFPGTSNARSARLIQDANGNVPLSVGAVIIIP